MTITGIVIIAIFSWMVMFTFLRNIHLSIRCKKFEEIIWREIAHSRQREHELRDLAHEIKLSMPPPIMTTDKPTQPKAILQPKCACGSDRIGNYCPKCGLGVLYRVAGKSGEV